MLVLIGVLGCSLLPVVLVVMLVAGTQSAQACSTSTTPAFDGPVGKPVTGVLELAQANIPTRSGGAGFASSMAAVTRSRPDFVTLNEMTARSAAQIQAAATGYTAWRDATPDPGPGGDQAFDTALMWRTDTWTMATGGRVKIVEDDHALYQGKPVVWDRFATWAMLEREDGAVVSVVSVHHMTNPVKFPAQHGDPPLTRAEQYGLGMDELLKLVDGLSAHGPVLVGGDFNTHADYTGRPWSAVAKMAAAGFGWASTGVDFTFFPRELGVELVSARDGVMASDHKWLAATLNMNGAGPRSTTPAPSTDALPGLTPDAAGVVAAITGEFGPHTYLGVGERPDNPASDHASGRAVDVMIDGWEQPAGIAHGDAVADWVTRNAAALGVTYVIWRAQIWSTADPAWRAYSHPSGKSDPTLLHMDHVHVSVVGESGTGSATSGGCAAGSVVYPVAAEFAANDSHNWGSTGALWASLHTGTDFPAPCSTPVYAATAGTVEIDTTQSWAGPQLVKVVTSQTGLATWYAHLERVDVAAGALVAAGQQIGAVGELGNAEGCHLHFEVHLRNGPIYGEDNVDPSVWLETNAGSPAA